MAAVRTDVRKIVHPCVFRRMKLRAFQEAYVGEYGIANVMCSGRRPEETQEEAGRVLGVELGVLGRVWNGIRGWLGG